jgi:hypothetical protein
MSLLIPTADSNTVYPNVHSPDFTFAVKQTEELWQQHYPRIAYMRLLKATTAVANKDTLSGEDGTTKFDPLWGEAVPAAVGTVWAQPHAHVNPDVSASEALLYAEPVDIHARIQRTAREDFLKKVGFDRVRSLLVTIPASLLDAVRISPTAGDRFRYDGELYSVLQASPMGWWMNTNTKMYVVLNCGHEHRGS